MKILPAWLLFLVLASCTIYAGSTNTSSRPDLPTHQISAATTIPITIPPACLPSVQAGDWSAKVASSCIVDQSREALIQVLFTVWLAHFKSPGVPEEYRLEAFAIVSIDNMEISLNSPKADFGAEVTFSVKPVLPLSSNPTSWWVAGDGFPGEDGWVRNKRDDVWVVKKADFYQIRLAPHSPT